MGIVSESGIFSEMGEYNQKTEIDDAKKNTGNVEELLERDGEKLVKQSEGT